MKHSLTVTLLIVLCFIVAQVMGLFIISNYVDVQKSAETGQTEFMDLPAIAGVPLERPDVEESYSWLYILLAIIIGTSLLLILIKYGKVWIWKAWFFFAVAVALYVAFAAFVSPYLAGAFALLLGTIKILKPRNNIMVFFQNFSELFIYGGLAAIFVPIFSLWSITLLLLFISAYDMYAVWKSKHMVKMATFQADSGVFAGLNIPYSVKTSTKTITPKKNKAKKKAKASKKSSRKVKKTEIVSAFLGGGDIAIPLLFTGTVFKFMGMMNAMLIIPFTTIALFLLLYFAQKNKFYPAMPFLSGGAFVGYGFVMLLSFL